MWVFCLSVGSLKISGLAFQDLGSCGLQFLRFVVVKA